jgi:hypothetical protein
LENELEVEHYEGYNLARGQDPAYIGCFVCKQFPQPPESVANFLPTTISDDSLHSLLKTAKTLATYI